MQSHRITCFAEQSDALTVTISVCSSKLQVVIKNVPKHKNMDYVRCRCPVNQRSELSIFCEIFKSYCLIFCMITSDVGQTAGKNNFE
jgi:hypothetical protein